MSSQDLSKDRYRATIADVAKRAGVSTATVSRVINHTGPVAQKTIESVLTAIADLNYRPHFAAQVLASRKTNTIGLLFQVISGEFFSSMLRGIESAARENGYKLLIYSTQGANIFNPTAPFPLGEHNTDGIIAFVDSLPHEELIQFNRIGFPVVLIHQPPPKGVRIPWVTIENKSGARKIVDHLIDVHNDQRIAFLAGDEGHDDAYWREMGYRESLETHGIPFNPELIAAGGFDREITRIAVEGWLESGQKFDAIFAGDDESAIGALSALDQAGIQVPGEIALVGFDDIYLSRYLSPPLTTVRAPIEQIGRQAIRLLVNLIQGKETETFVLLPTELVIRQSCGCP